MKWIAGLTLAFLIGACADDVGSDCDDVSSCLSSAEQLAESAHETAGTGHLDRPSDLGDGLTVTLSNPRAVVDGDGSYLALDVRAENVGDDALNPSLAIYCVGNPEGGGYRADSTFPFTDELPSQTVSEGIVKLLLPREGRLGETVVECETPAFVRITHQPKTTDASPRTVDVVVPSSVIRGIYASRAVD